MPKNLKIFTGNANPVIAREICEYLKVPLGAAEVKKFSDGEISVEIGENVRGADVFIIQPTCTPVNDNLMELIIMIDAVRRASARRITAVMPYYGYARQDRKVRPRVPITAKAVAEMLTVVGTRRVLCMDLHAGQIQGFFNIPVDHLYAAPIILNPYFLIPFLFAPVANVLIGKFFIDFLGMNGFIYAMPWALPGPIGTFIDTNFQPISLVLVVVLLVVDFLIYYPFCKAYDNVLCKQEAETLAEEEAEETKAVKTAAAPAVEAPVVETASATEASAAPSALKGKDLRVLVLCAGAGTSALLANALKEGADELGIDITANAGAYGSHYAIMDQYNVIVLAPQVRTYYNEMKADTDRLGITLLSPKGKQYIDLTKDPKGAVAWIEENLEA